MYIPQQTGYVKGDLRGAFGEWLTQFKWDWWATFTFRRDTSPYRAKKSFLHFTRECIHRHAYYFMAVEWHAYRDCVHIHALMGNVAEIRRMYTLDRWYVAYGIARIWPYVASLGAKYYLCKYLTKELSDWDFNFGKVRVPAFGSLTAIAKENT